MKERDGWILMAACVLLVLAAVGCVGASCMDECIEAGNTEARCFNICRP